MRDVVLTSSGSMWREVESVEEGNRIGNITRTAFGWFFENEQRRGQANRYFALGESFRVIGCVPLSPPPYKGSPAHGMPLFVTHHNGNPFPQYAREIGELNDAIGAEISPTHYPYRGSPNLGESAEPSRDDDPTPSA